MVITLSRLLSFKAFHKVPFSLFKTEVIIFGPTLSTAEIGTHSSYLAAVIHNDVRKLGIFHESSLSFDKQISSVVKSRFYQLTQIAILKSDVLKDLFIRYLFIHIST